MSTDLCPINRCGRDLGAGTHMQVELPNGETPVLAVCEDHWQALRPILPAPVPATLYRQS